MRRAAGVGGHSGPGGGRAARCRGCRRAAAAPARFPVERGPPVAAIAERLTAWLEAPADAARRDARGARGDGARALVVGGRGARRDRRRGGAPDELPERAGDRIAQ